MKTFIRFFSYILFMLCSQSALAEMAAKVIFAKGEVYVVNSNGKQSALAKGATLEQGDTIMTKAGNLQVRFTDGGMISFYENTEFKIDDYHFSEKNDGNDKAFFHFVKGVFRTIVGSIKKDRYQVKTNVASIGTRGTEYSAKLSNKLQIDVFEGTVILKNQAGNFAVSAGHSALMSDILSMPEFINLENRIYKQPGINGGQIPRELGEKGEHKELPHNEKNELPVSHNNQPPRHREQDSHRRDMANPSEITIENILNKTISPESLQPPVQEPIVLPPEPPTPSPPPPPPPIPPPPEPPTPPPPPPEPPVPPPPEPPIPPPSPPEPPPIEPPPMEPALLP